MRHWTDFIVEGVDEAGLKKDVANIVSALRRNKVRAGKAALTVLDDLTYTDRIGSEKIDWSNDTRSLLKWALENQDFKRGLLLRLRSMNKSTYLLKDVAWYMLRELPKYGQGPLAPSK